MTSVAHGIPRHSEARSLIPASSRDEMDAAVGAVAAAKDAWAAVTPVERVRLLGRLLQDFSSVADRWVAASLEAKGIAPGSPAEVEEWIAGPFCVLRNIRLLREALRDVARHGTVLFQDAMPPVRPKIIPRIYTTSSFVNGSLPNFFTTRFFSSFLTPLA